MKHQKYLPLEEEAAEEGSEAAVGDDEADTEPAPHPVWELFWAIKNENPTGERWLTSKHGRMIWQKFLDFFRSDDRMAIVWGNIL